MASVQLALYDLSHGMARQISSQFLGGPEHAIDIVPHTGIIVFGKEYFFGGGAGISAEDPDFFRTTRGMAPIQVISIGTTNVTQNEFENWCAQQTAGGKYSGSSYDLFRNNCNNFSNDAAVHGLRLSQGVPQYILDIPDRFLRSPMGQMIQPMLQGMQVRGSGGIPFVPTGEGFDAKPIVNTSTSFEPPNPWAAESTAANVTSSKIASKATSTPKPDTPNPWEGKPTKPNENSSKTAPEAYHAIRPETPLLNKNHGALLSTDRNTSKTCAKKFESDAIRKAADLLADGSRVPNDILQQSCHELLAELCEGNQLTFGLMLLRLLVLADFDTTAPGGATSNCIEWTKSQLVNPQCSLSHPAKSMAWCTMSNAATSMAELSKDMSLLDAAFKDITTSTRSEVRQAAASFVYNVTLCVDTKETNDELSEVVVALLCGSMDSIHDESDETAMKRRLLAVGRLVSRDANVARLTADLGFDQVLKTLEVEDELREIVDEIMALIKFFTKPAVGTEINCLR